MKRFKAYVVSEMPSGSFTGAIEERKFEPLEENQVRIKVKYSSLNYKDVLSATGNKGITRNYPHVPGIDAAGVVSETNTDRFQVGDEVIVTGYDLGMNRDGGFEQYIRVPSDWVVAMPPRMDAREAMSYGTAGFTAALCVGKIASVVSPADGPILVTGSTGGVGSFSIAILHKLGYRVIAVTGKAESESYLKTLGATEINGREQWETPMKEPMLKGTIAGGVDTVGGAYLENMIKSTALHGAVSCCGMVSSSDLHLSVFPFILRGVTLFGITSQNTRMAERISIWNKLSDEYAVKHLSTVIREITLTELPDAIREMREGKLRGRVLVNLWK